MGRVCSEVQDWIEETVEQVIEDWENQQQQRCRDEECNWWILCLNKLFCWFVWVLVKITRIILVTIGKWITRLVCEVIDVVLDAIGWIVLLILSIPIIGGIIRTILNWLTDIVWHIIGLPDFILSLLGVRLRKKMYVGAVIPAVDGARVATDDQMIRQVDGLTQLYNDKCNVNVIFTGICHTDVSPPSSALDPSCDAAGFFNDWWLAGSFFELATTTCRFTDSFRRVIGFGAELLIFAVREIEGATRGCSFGSTHNYVLVECRPEHPPFIAAHEIGHSCWLLHRDAETNLMHAPSPATDPQLTNWQIAVIRWSKHCVFF
jgi:hypothetical protein